MPSDKRGVCRVRGDEPHRRSTFRDGDNPSDMGNLLPNYERIQVSVLANLMIGKYADHIPFYRQLEMLKRLGIDIPPATLNGWFLDVALSLFAHYKGAM